MKIKVFISSINKNLFFSLGFVLFTGLVLLFNWMFSLPVRQSDAIRRQLVRTEQQVSRLQSMQTEFMLRAGRTEDPFSGEKILSQQDAASVITAIRNDLGYYRRHKLVSGNARITSVLNEFAGSLDQVEEDLNEFIMASRERGDENSGLISRWCELSSRMAKASGFL